MARYAQTWQEVGIVVIQLLENMEQEAKEEEEMARMSDAFMQEELEGNG